MLYDKCRLRAQKRICVFLIVINVIFIVMFWDKLYKRGVKQNTLLSANLVDKLKTIQVKMKSPIDLKKCFVNAQSQTSNVLVMREVSVFPDNRLGKRKGGENISEVKNQREQDEYFIFRRGFLHAKCVSNTEKQMKKILAANRKSLAAQLLNSLTAASNSSNLTNFDTGVTLGIIRIDYANVYWTFMELYGAYLTALEMKTRSRDATLLIMDAHPVSSLDGIWEILFKKVIRVGWFDTPVNFSSLAIVPELKLNPIAKKTTPLPHIQSFTQNVSTLVGASPEREINCQKLKVTLILRKNYVAHPRNMGGKISRQLANPEETIKHLQSMPDLEAQAVALETLSIKNQIRLIANETDILIGVHGAGLAHTLFQIRGAGMIELFPHSYWKGKNKHMEMLCTKSGKHYDSWYSGEKNKDTVHVPLDVMTKLISKMAKTICKTSS